MTTLCPNCHGMGILPNRMDEEDGPVCACGKPSRRESGDCGEGHGPIKCKCQKPLPPNSVYAASVIREKGLCGHITRAYPSDLGCILPIGHDDGVHEPIVECACKAPNLVLVHGPERCAVKIPDVATSEREPEIPNQTGARLDGVQQSTGGFSSTPDSKSDERRPSSAAQDVEPEAVRSGEGVSGQLGFRSRYVSREAEEVRAECRAICYEVHNEHSKKAYDASKLLGVEATAHDHHVAARTALEIAKRIL
jgi:hypothetical protein